MQIKVKVLGNQKKTVNSLASGCFQGFLEKNASTYVALRGNISIPIRVTDLVEASKDAANLLVCTWKIIFCLGVAVFLWVTS